jgi:ribosomal protein L12E/L44/L45/RPP1/RPP2
MDATKKAVVLSLLKTIKMLLSNSDISSDAKVTAALVLIDEVIKHVESIEAESTRNAIVETPKPKPPENPTEKKTTIKIEKTEEKKEEKKDEKKSSVDDFDAFDFL